MKRFAFAALALICLPFASLSAQSLQIRGNSTTMPYFHEEEVDGEWRSLLALYEFVDAEMRNAGAAGLDFYVSAWGRADALDREDIEEEEFGDAELDAAYVRYAHQEGWVDAHLGRRVVRIGPVARRMDGADARFDPLPWIGVQAFCGVPVMSSLGERDGDFGFGGRVYGGLPPYFEIGASYADFLEKNEPDRRRMGGDFRVFPLRMLDILGHAYYDMLYDQWYDAEATVLARPVTDLELMARYERVVPSAFLGMQSIFSVFSLETVNKATARARYVVINRVVMEGEYVRLDYKERSSADRFGGLAGVLWGSSRENTFRVGAGRVEGEDDDDYTELRASVYQDILGVVYLSADGMDTLLDREAREEDRAYYATLSLGWRATRFLDLQASGFYVDSPYYDERLRGLLKVSIDFDWLQGRRDG